MRDMMWCLALCLVVAASAVQGQPWKKPDPFVGTWKMNHEKTQLFRGTKPRIENITIKVDNDVQDYKNELAHDQDPSHVQGHESKYNEVKWVPYMNYATGQTVSYVMTIKVDDRTHYRFTRRADGQAGGVMMRRLSEDGNSFSSIDLDVNGKTNYIRVFEKLKPGEKPPK